MTAINRVRRSLQFSLLLIAAAISPSQGVGQGMTVAGAPAATAGRDSAIARFANALAQGVESDAAGAITAGVVLGDRLVWTGAFGFADKARGVPATERTVYRIGSISKSFTAVLLLQLAEQKVVALDDSVVRSLPEVARLANRPAGTKAITFRQLASHTAGLIREPGLRGAAAGPFELWEQRIIESIPTTSFDTVPGARYSYSNIGFGILGLALARAARAPFPDLVTTRILRPLGMTQSGFHATPEIRTHLATGYANRPGELPDTVLPALEHAGRGYKVPNGGIYSTVSDLGRFMIAMWGGGSAPVLPPASRVEAMKVQTPGNPRNGYGLGFTIATAEDGRRIVSHGGSVSGYTAHLAFDPEARIGVVLLRNYAGGRVNLAARANELIRELRATR